MERSLRTSRTTVTTITSIVPSVADSDEEDIAQWAWRPSRNHSLHSVSTADTWDGPSKGSVHSVSTADTWDGPSKGSVHSARRQEASHRVNADRALAFDEKRFGELLYERLRLSKEQVSAVIEALDESMVPSSEQGGRTSSMQSASTDALSPSPEEAGVVVSVRPLAPRPARGWRKVRESWRSGALGEAYRYEKATHFVQNWSILFANVVVYFAATCDPPRLAFIALIIAFQVASIMHWLDYRLDGWRKMLDILLATAALLAHLGALHRDPAIASAHKYLGSTFVALSTTSFVVGHHRHAKGYIGQGMCGHLAFRYFGFWVFIIVHAHDRFSVRGSVIFFIVLNIVYVVVCFALWRCGRWIYSG